MKWLFVDTSAIFAILDADDQHHAATKAAWIELLQSETRLLTSNYILVESCALLQNRLGLEAVRTFNDDIVPLLDVRWVNTAVHKAAESAHRSQARRNLSLVDCTSFEIMRQAGVKSAFILDRHFGEQGFECVPDIRELAVKRAMESFGRWKDSDTK